METKILTTNHTLFPFSEFQNDTKDLEVIKRNMAIKENEDLASKSFYSTPIKSTALVYLNNRNKIIQDAKNAFLNSTISTNSTALRSKINTNTELNLHYAHMAITTESEDSRSTGGGTIETTDINTSTNTNDSIIINGRNNKKKGETPQRKVSFKVKNTSTNYKRPLMTTKTMTITGNKVAELTKKFNELVQKSDGVVPQAKLEKTLEDLQLVSRCSLSNSSTPSSTLSSSPNIKIVLRQKRSSRKRSSKKRCSSADSIDKIINSENNRPPKKRVVRSKSDGIKRCKTAKKSLCFQETKKHQLDTIDGRLKDLNENISEKNTPSNANVVKSTIKKFECQIIAHSNCNIAVKHSPSCKTNNNPIKEKPKVPEKKCSLIVTKNLVVKDGIPKFKTIKTVNKDLPKTEDSKTHSANPIHKKKEPIYDKKKYKTNYIHSDKLSLHVVDIIHEDIGENAITNSSELPIYNNDTNEDVKIYEELSSQITPNESFLWRRKSSNADSDKYFTDNSYSIPNNIPVFSYVTSTPINENSSNDFLESQGSDTIVDTNSNMYSNINVNLDFESNLVEAFNKEVVINVSGQSSTTKRNSDVLESDQIVNNSLTTSVNVFNRQSSKVNCPLPEIPKDIQVNSQNTNLNENIYQCLLEMRSHPEGDETSLHSYELCQNALEERTRGDGDSDDGYEYCKTPTKIYCHTSTGNQITQNYRPVPPKRNNKNYEISKSVSGASTVSYEKIDSDRIYEKIPSRTGVGVSRVSISNRNSFVSVDYPDYNNGENIYDTVKHSDGASHCYESIPSSPSLVKLRTNFRKQLASAVQKRLSFDSMSNISHTTISSEQKTNSIYGQRSIISFNGQEVSFQVPNSDTSVSDRSDRSDDWVDVSDEEINDEQKIIIVHERNRGRRSPVSWAQKVRHQWQKSPKQKTPNPEGDSSDSGHLYESLELAAAPIDDDFDSFDSDSDEDIPRDNKTKTPELSQPTQHQLPEPPGSGGSYTLTKIASAAQRKMREIKRNLTKRYSVALDGRSFNKLSQNNQDSAKNKSKSPVYANCGKSQPEIQHIYGNLSYPDNKPLTNLTNKTETPLVLINGTNFKEELKTVIGDKTNPYEIPPPLPDKPVPDKPTTPTASESSKGKDSGTLSRKTYFSFKSRFRRASSMAVDINTDVPGALKITNSTFYLTDSIDGDSGFSNCSDSGQLTSGSAEVLHTSPSHASAHQLSSSQRQRRRDGTRPIGRRSYLCESSPCLALERPAVPPPPPPPLQTDLSAVNEELKRLLPTLSRKDRSPRTRTSWYAGCGAMEDLPTPTLRERPTSSSWYAEAGLYQAGNISSSSGASSGSHPASPLPHSLFTHEPLYQFYNAAKLESVCRDFTDSDSDGYDLNSIGVTNGIASQVTRPSAMALVAPVRGPSRTLWCEVPEVVGSAVLSSLAPAQKRLQEAKFEILTSEASYLNSLNVLESHFIAHPAFRDPAVLPHSERDILFSTILPVKKCSKLLMNELEKCWQENILLHGLCEVVRRHAQEHFHVYVKYCEHQSMLVKTLQRLRERPIFTEALRRLEAHPLCQSLSLHSFLMLPMQRITRLPLLMDAVLRNLNEADQEYQSCMDALATLNTFVSQCNEGARNMERIEEMFRLSSCIEFPATLYGAPELGPACGRRTRCPIRWLVRSGELTHLVWKGEDHLKLTFGRKFHKQTLYLFLFNDVLVITKKRSEDSYLAIDFCPRSLLEISTGDVLQPMGKEPPGKHLMLLTLLENYEGRTVEMLMSCSNETDASRWAEALAASGGCGGTDGEAVYAGWDCPQVAALYAYAPTQPDELALTEGDVINVTRKMPEGWYYGERIRDGETGWFPGSYTVEIASPHVRARNLKQRYRLLALSASYLGQRRKPI